MGTHAGDDQAPGALGQAVGPRQALLAVGTGKLAGGLLERLVEENLGWLQGWLRGRVRDPHLADDICQDSFLKALRAAPRLKDLSKFSFWLYRIAENSLRDHLRREKRWRQAIQLSDELDEVETRTGEDALGKEEEAQELLEAVRALPPRYREPLLLRHARELPYAEIGAILGISENAVQVRIHRARKMLRSRADGKHPQV